MGCGWGLRRTVASGHCRSGQVIDDQQHNCDVCRELLAWGAGGGSAEPWRVATAALVR